MSASFDTARWFAMAACLREETRHVADRIVARARTARRFGATAEAYRSTALSLDRQADRAANLVFGRAAETLRAAADEHRLVADALEIFEEREDAR